MTPGYTLYVYILPNDIQKKDYNMKLGLAQADPAKRSEVRRVYILAQARTRTRTIWHALTVDLESQSNGRLVEPLRHAMSLVFQPTVPCGATVLGRLASLPMQPLHSHSGWTTTGCMR